MNKFESPLLERLIDVLPAQVDEDLSTTSTTLNNASSSVRFEIDASEVQLGSVLGEGA